MRKIKDFFKKYYVELSVLFLLILFLVIGLFRQKDVPIELPKQESTKVWRDKDGKEHHKTEVVVAQKPNDFLNTKSKDEHIKALQEQVNYYKKQLKNKGSISNIESVTSINKVVETIVKDTVYVDRFGQYHPIYTNNISDDWVNGYIETSKDSAKINLKIKNDYTVIIGEDKQGFLGLGKSKTFAEVINHNPYTETKSLKVYVTDKPKNKMFGIGPYVGLGLDRGLKIIPTIGIGLQYNMLRF